MFFVTIPLTWKFTVPDRVEKMTKPYALLMASFILFHCTVQEEPPATECGNSPGNNDRVIKVSLYSKINQTGEWVDTFTARTGYDNSSSHFYLDVTHRVIECDGKRFVYVQGTTKDTSVEINEDKIKFHPICGKNVAISSDGLTVQRINFDDPVNSDVLTSRPLKNNEMFEVRIEKKITKYNNGIGIGITTISPDTGKIIPQMHKSPNSWMYHNTNIWSNNNVFLFYNARDVSVLQVGDRIGVMRNNYGALHFFVNGVDQGPAMSNVPRTVYGVVDLRYNDVKATIVDANISSSS